MNKGYLAVALVAVVVLGGLGAFLFLSGGDSAPAGYIRLGATVSLTGTYATEGSRVLTGYQLGIDYVNTHGGVMVNGSKYLLELKSYDDESNKDKAATLYDTLIDTDNAQILLGPYGSSNVLSVAPKAEAAEIPLIQAGGSSDSIYNKGYQYVFGLYRVASTYTSPVFEWLNDSTKISDITSVVAFVENEAFSNSVWLGASKFINNTAIPQANVKMLQHATGDLDAIATQMATVGDPDLILAIGHYADSKKVVEEIKAQSLTPKVVFGTVGIPEEKFVTELGTNGEKAMGFAQWVPNIPETSAPGITDFVTLYTANTTEAPSYHGAGGYAAIQVVKAAVEKANSLNPKLIRTALTTLDVDTIWGNVKFESTGVIGGAGYMVQILNSKIETVYPTVYKTKDIVYPFS
jgi:branched-chain amino acid transport system substrate-binding protein